MFVSTRFLWVLYWAGGLAVGVQAAQPAEPDAVVRKAIQAMGGAEKLAKVKASVSKGKCKFYGNGRAIACDGEWSMQLPGQLKASYLMEIGGKKVTRVEVINGDRGWIATRGKTKSLPADQLADIREGMEAEYATTLLPLKDPGYRLTSLGESRIGDRSAVGLKVSRPGHRDFLLYFDADRGFLLKLQLRVKGMDGRDVEQETYYSNYQDFDGTKSYRNLTTKRDGKLFLEWEATAYKAVEKLPESTFAKPGA